MERKRDGETSSGYPIPPGPTMPTKKPRKYTPRPPPGVCTVSARNVPKAYRGSDRSLMQTWTAARDSDSRRLLVSEQYAQTIQRLAYLRDHAVSERDQVSAAKVLLDCGTRLLIASAERHESDYLSSLQTAVAQIVAVRSPVIASAVESVSGSAPARDEPDTRACATNLTAPARDEPNAVQQPDARMQAGAGGDGRSDLSPVDDLIPPSNFPQQAEGNGEGAKPLAGG